MTTSTSGGVDLDKVLVVADDLRRICHWAIKFGVTFSTFKQESWEAALACNGRNNNVPARRG